MIKDAYEELKKKNKGLPSFEEMDDEFEVSSLENERFLVRGIKKRMADRLDEVAGMLSDIVHPSSEGMAVMYEYRFFDTKEKKNIVYMYKRVQFLLRSFSEADVVQEDDHDMKLIIEVFKAWKDLRKECVPIARRLKECWTKETEYKEDLGYLG